MRTTRKLDASAKRKKQGGKGHSLRLLFCIEKSRGCGQSTARIAVDLNSCVGSLLAVGLVFVSSFLKEDIRLKQVPMMNVSFLQR